jgi:hypothetical protein
MISKIYSYFDEMESKMLPILERGRIFGPFWPENFEKSWQN